jgi:hypothetical protein
MADMSRAPDAMQNILRTGSDGAGAKQKGRGGINPSRPTLQFGAAAVHASTG